MFMAKQSLSVFQPKTYMQEQNLTLIGILLFFVLIALGGGSSRPNVTSLLFIQPVNAFLVILLLSGTSVATLKPVRVPLLLLMALAVIMIAQMIPLPPVVWQSLPGHERFSSAAALASLPQPWRPISLQPDLTASSLMALLTPLIVLLGFASIQRLNPKNLAIVIVTVTAISTILGILQVTSPDLTLKLYTLSNDGQPLGLFANRNHQAALLAISIPVIRLWILCGPRIGSKDRREKLLGYLRLTSAIALALLVLPTLILTGSRMGLLLGLMGLGSAVLIAPGKLILPKGKARPWIALAYVGGPLILLATMIMLGRAIAFERLFASDLIGGEQRFVFAPITFRIALVFFPFGSGFGTFDKVFRIYEPDAVLKPSYFNHAHNDFVEILINGGLPAACLLLVFAGWLACRIPQLVHRPSSGHKPERWAGRTGMCCITIIAVASITDYPLRTPLMAAIFTLMVCWVAADRPASMSRR